MHNFASTFRWQCWFAATFESSYCKIYIFMWMLEFYIQNQWIYCRATETNSFTAKYFSWTNLIFLLRLLLVWHYCRQHRHYQHDDDCCSCRCRHCQYHQHNFCDNNNKNLSSAIVTKCIFTMNMQKAVVFDASKKKKLSTTLFSYDKKRL